MSADPKTTPGDKPADAFSMLGDFKPKAPGSSVAATPEIAKDIEKVADKNGFLSRQAKATAPAKRKRFNSSENKVQLNLKVPEATRERFYAMAESRKIRVLADLLEKAMDALDKVDPVK